MPKLIVGLLLVAAALLAGCGGGSSTTETTATLSKSEFLAQGNAVCEEGEKAQQSEVNAYVEEENLANKNPSAAQEAAMVENIIAPNIEGQINDVKALAAPASVEGQVEEAIELAEEALEEVEAEPSIAVTSSADPFAAAGKVLHSIGLTKCAPNS
jgi:hydroxymethylpyrimidine pyrophosphatase-like HAD family hydrolase